MADVILEQSAPKPASPIKPFLLMVGVLVLVGVSAYAGYWYGKNSQTPISSEKETTATEKVKEELPSVIDETAEWKTYSKDSKSFGSFSVKYPEGWIVTENQTEDPKGEQIITTLSKTDHKIEINAFMSGWSPSGCNFDKTVKNKPQTSYYDSYVDLGNLSIELRRALPPTEYNNALAWSICAKESTTNLFATALPFSGVITYFTPTNFNEAVVKEMDQILSTFRFE